MYCLTKAIAHFVIKSSYSKLFRWQVNTISYEVEVANNNAVWISILRNVLWDMTFVDGREVQVLTCKGYDATKTNFRGKVAVLKCLKNVNCKFFCDCEGFTREMNVRYVTTVAANQLDVIWRLCEGDV